MQFRMPDDGWGKISPRSWQSEALPKLLAEYSKPNPISSVVRAVTGSGKSKLMAQMAACCHLEPNECVVVSTSSIFLVEQLEETFRERLDNSAFMSGPSSVGCFYMHGKNTTAPVIITCTPSLPELAKRLGAAGRKCALWIGDEIQKSAAPTIMTGHSILSPAASCGYSATPFRAKWKESLTLFQQQIIDYTAEEAIRDGVVVECIPVFWQGGEGDLDSVCIDLTALASGPGMYNSVSIQDAEMFNLKLIDNGIISQTIHSHMSKAERKKRLEDLRTGRLQALVHCSLLQEGCDLPWLRWLCMRRPVGSRVRFVQEIGRVVRSYTDPITGDKKTCAFIYDPHGLFQDFSLTYKEVLGGVVDEPDEDEEKPIKLSEKKKKQMEQLVYEVMKELVSVKAGRKPLSFTPIAAYLMEITTAFDLCKLIKSKLANREWRRLPSSPKQAEAIKKMAFNTNKAVVPKLHQKPLEMLTDFVPQLSRGLAADLFDIQVSLAEFKKWPDFRYLDRSAEDSIRARPQSVVTMPSTPSQSIVLPHKSTAQQKLFE